MNKITYLIVHEFPPRPHDYMLSFAGNEREKSKDPSSSISLDRTIVLCVDSDEIFDRNILATFRDLPFLSSQTHLTEGMEQLSLPLFFPTIRR